MNEPVKRVDEWRPNWNRKCVNCDATPCVQGWAFDFSQDHQPDYLVYDGELCGVCTWGEAACVDPENW